MIQLGEKLDNPFSIDNMQKAADNLLEAGLLKSKKTIKPSHYYIRFLPKTGSEIDKLIEDSEIELFYYPLDYEIISEGNFYRDPHIPEGEPFWLYTVVPVKYKFPKIEYELLEECYIPEEEATLKSGQYLNINQLLEREAYRITGNLESTGN